MANTPTPHNAARLGDIAKKVLMAGDPLRAKLVADNYLENVRLYNDVRNMFGYTGTYKGEPVSVQGHGMGIPSIGIYSYELYNFYDVETIVRIGTAGGLTPDVGVGSIVIAQEAITDSNYGYQFDLPKDYRALASPELVEAAERSAQALGVPFLTGKVCSSDIFYNKKEVHETWARQGVLAVEMEAWALYSNADVAGRKGLTILTVSDNVVTGEELSAEERQNNLHNMIRVALDM